MKHTLVLGLLFTVFGCNKAHTFKPLDCAIDQEHYSQLVQIIELGRYSAYVQNIRGDRYAIEPYKLRPWDCFDRFNMRLNGPAKQ